MKKETLKTTTNSSVYKKIKTRVLERDAGLCRYCAPHRGCNYWYGGRKPNRSWKEYRNTQWK